MATAIGVPDEVQRIIGLALHEFIANSLGADAFYRAPSTAYVAGENPSKRDADLRMPKRLAPVGYMSKRSPL